MTTPGATPPLRDPRIILDEILASIAMIQSYLAQVAQPPIHGAASDSGWRSEAP